MADAHLADETLQEFVEHLLGDAVQQVQELLICWEMQVTAEILRKLAISLIIPRQACWS